MPFPEAKGPVMAMQPTPSDPLTPAVLRQNVIGDQVLFWGAFWEWFGPRLSLWARTNLRRAGIDDPDTADDVVLRLIAKLKARWTYDPAKGPLRTYLRRAVFNEVKQELRLRLRRPGDYGTAPSEDLLDELEDSIDASLGDVDTDWQRQRRERTHAAVERARGRCLPHEWETFYLVYVEGRGGPEVAREVNQRFRLPQPLKQMQVYPIKNRVRRLFLEELSRAGIDFRAADPETFFPILREVLDGGRRAEGQPPGRGEES
jgi:DNA-directed RNA polymerase specialized sigma24 family protein